MSQPALILSECERLYASCRGKSFDELKGALQTMDGSLSPRDQVAVREFLEHPVEIAQGVNSAYAHNGSHRICALRTSVPLESLIVVRIL